MTAVEAAVMAAAAVAVMNLDSSQKTDTATSVVEESL
jgi:hypothetical protein